MIRRLPPVRVPDAANEALEEGPLIVGYQVARQDHLPRRDELESQVADQRNPFCQHDLGVIFVPDLGVTEMRGMAGQRAADDRATLFKAPPVARPGKALIGFAPACRIADIVGINQHQIFALGYGRAG